MRIDVARMDPAHTNYKKQVQYAVMTEFDQALKAGENALAVELLDNSLWNVSFSKALDLIFALSFVVS
jgi:hypothetical protein